MQQLKAALKDMSSEEDSGEGRKYSMEMEREDLRLDIRQNNQIMHGLLTALITAVGAATAWVFTTNKPVLFIALFLIMIPIVAKTSLLLHANIHIAGYIINVLESPSEKWNPNKWQTPQKLTGEWSPPGRWETHYQYYRLSGIPRYRKIGAFLLMSNALNAYIALAVYGMFWVSLSTNGMTYWWLPVLITVFLVVIVLFWVYDADNLLWGNKIEKTLSKHLPKYLSAIPKSSTENPKDKEIHT